MFGVFFITNIAKAFQAKVVKHISVSIPSVRTENSGSLAILLVYVMNYNTVMNGHHYELFQ